MSEATPTQPVVTETPASAQPDAKAPDARTEGDLDSLLKVYDETTAAPAQPIQPEQTPGTEPDLKTIAAQMQRFENLATAAVNDKFKRDMSTTVKAIRGDLPEAVFDDVLVEAYLDAQAKQDPRLAKAWLDRDANPRQFEQVKTALAKSFAKKFSSMPDRAATEDRDAVSAAVRGASNRAPASQPANLGGMTDQELREHTKKQYGFSAV